MRAAPMSDSARPPSMTSREAFAQLELAATRELGVLAAQLPAPTPAIDPLFSHLAWDLGLSGEAALGATHHTHDDAVGTAAALMTAL